MLTAYPISWDSFIEDYSSEETSMSDRHAFDREFSSFEEIKELTAARVDACEVTLELPAEIYDFMDESVRAAALKAFGLEATYGKWEFYSSLAEYSFRYFA